MKITYLGHAAFMLSENGLNVLTDPFLSESPVRNNLNCDVKADYILVSHGHPDHLGDTVNLASKYNSRVVSIFEVATYLSKKGVENIAPMNIGGKLNTEFGYVKMCQAVHSSSIMEGDERIYGGIAAGFIINFFEKIIYFAGDTALFYDMKLIGDLNKIDVAFLPVGGNFTMDVDEALYALDLIKPKMVIPMHYNTWPVINADIEKFLKGAETKKIKGVCLGIDESVEI